MMSSDGCSWFFSKMKSLDDVWRNDINTASRIDTRIICSILDLSWQDNDWDGTIVSGRSNIEFRGYRTTNYIAINNTNFLLLDDTAGRNLTPLPFRAISSNMPCINLPTPKTTLICNEKFT